MEIGNHIPEIASLLMATLLIAVTAVKTEFIKSFVTKATGSKYSMIYIVLGIIVTTVITYVVTALIGPTEKTDQEATSEKTEAEIYRDLAVESIEYGIDKFNDIKDNRNEKDSIYEATRERKWVYQIGDVVNDQNLLFDIYISLYNPGNVRVFQIDRSQFLLFQEDCGDETIMQNSLTAFENSCANDVDCRVVDLVAYCDRKEKLMKIEDLKIKKDGEKLFLPCYECGK